MMNAELTQFILQSLLTSGIDEFCVCPGARNAPIVALLSSRPDLFKTVYHFEERSAAFFALGRIRRTGKPVAVVTTSGTAVGELLPATMEAYYAGLPLVLLTADRPRRFQGSGAPQAGEQVGIFGIYAEKSWDLESTERPELKIPSNQMKPVHINVRYDEPLLEDLSSNSELLFETKNFSVNPIAEVTDSWKKESQEKIRGFLKDSHHPIVVVGMLSQTVHEAVIELLLELQYPVYLECLSGIREEIRLDSLRIHLADRLMERSLQADYPVDGVLRIGGVPTHRFWRDLDSKYAQLPVLTLSSLPFSGLGRPQSLVYGNLEEILDLFRSELQSNPKKTEVSAQFLLKKDHHQKSLLQGLLHDEPLSEPGMIALLSEGIPKKSRVYVGNSLPIREWDLAGTWTQRNYQMWASRGMNGIDGQLSTFLGYANVDSDNWGIFGDLTALYDLSGPWILPQLTFPSVNIVVVNNEGGKIFSRMFPHKEFQNRHQIRFSEWAKLWNLNYERWTEVPESQFQFSGGRVIELLPDEGATQRFWNKYQNLLK